MAKNNPHNLQVGQKLYIVYNRNVSRGGAEYLEVLKIGNKWATIGHLDRSWSQSRVHLEELYIDGGQYTSPGSAYLSEQHYKDEVALKTAWSRLHQSLSYHVPSNLTMEKLNQIKVLLGEPYSKL